jgi:hypothetical protein
MFIGRRKVTTLAATSWELTMPNLLGKGTDYCKHPMVDVDFHGRKSNPTFLRYKRTLQTKELKQAQMLIFFFIDRLRITS